MSENQIATVFKDYLIKHDMSPGLATICTLLNQLKSYKASTMAELSQNLKKTSRFILQNDDVLATTCISSSSELFQRHITLESLKVLEVSNFENVQNVLVAKGEKFLENVLASRKKILLYSSPFINEGVTILTHSMSTNVEQVLNYAKSLGKNFKVFVTQSMPDESGNKMMEKLKQKSIFATLILDSAVAYLMEQVDIVLLGAEGITANGGIINKIGCYQICMAAKFLKKPVYIVSESIKFSKVFPLKQDDIPKVFRYKPSLEDTLSEHPRVDYTPPDLIDVLITDLGVLTPSTVTEELMNLYL